MISIKELNLSELGSLVKKFFTQEEIEQLSRETGFIQRKRKLTGCSFLDLVIFNSESLKKQSLNDVSIDLKDKYNIDIKKQSLQEKFNEKALSFLRAILEGLINRQIEVDRLTQKYNKFKRIMIKDSVCFQISETLKEYYPGSGGSGSKASIRIQFEYDILSCKINDLSVKAFNKQDSRDAIETINLIRKGDLIVRDLAYMHNKALELIDKTKAYFVCRVSSNNKIYEKKGDNYKEINFGRLSKQMKKENIQSMEKEVYIGSTKKRKVRLMLYLLPEEVASEKLRKARANRKKKGRQLSKEYIARVSLNFFITNCESEQLVGDKLWEIYRLRWQIELIFKIFKSICKIEQVKKVKQKRLECYIYSKLILIVLSWQIIWKTSRVLFMKKGKVLSIQKAFKTLVRKIEDMRKVFLLGTHSLESFMKKFYELSITNHLLEKRKKDRRTF